MDVEDLTFPGGGEAFQIRSTVWDMVVELCPEGEMDEVKRLLGTSLVEQLNDLQEEVATMLEIWRQMREDGNASMQPTVKLAEPPYVRETLIKEIKFFLNSLHKRSGALPPALGKVVEYVNLSSITAASSQTEGDYSGKGISSGSTRDLSSAGHRSGGSRPDSAVSSWDGRETPLRLGSGSGRQSSSLSENFMGEINNEHINSTGIDQVISKLREGMELDCEQCRLDLNFLQSCIDGEQNYVSSSLQQQQDIPTISELREVGTKLEKEFLSSSHCPTTSMSGKKTLNRLVPIPPTGPKPLGSSLNRASKIRRANNLSCLHGNDNSISHPPSENLSLVGEDLT